MKCIAWNCRGLGRPDFSSNFSFLCSLVRLDLFCLIETKIAMDRVPCNFHGRFFNKCFAVIHLAEQVEFVYFGTMVQ